jgi:hypothetical protein
MKTIVYRIVCLLVAGLTVSCASVDQFGSRAYDGNLNTESAFNQEVLVNIVRASQYQALSWNPPSQLTGNQSESLATGLPTITNGPHQMAPYIYSLANSLTSGVMGSYTTAPLATTTFQAGMLTPVDLKTIASLQTYYPREVIFYALIGAIDVKSESSPPQYARLVNDPGQAYFDQLDYSNLDQTHCDDLMNGSDKFALFFQRNPKDPRYQCSYAKFLNLMKLLIEYGLYTELVQIPAPATTQAQTQANQSNIVTLGRFCFNRNYTPQGLLLLSTSFPPCGLDRKQPLGGTVMTTNTETHKADDVAITTDTKSVQKQTITTTTSILPITGRNFRVNFQGIGWVDITFELRSPNGFLSYLGSWFNNRDKIAFARSQYRSIPAWRIFNDGPYLSILNIGGPCYSSVNYEGQTYCVPLEATHTTMLMDIAVILRNLSISPTDLNAPVSVRVTD